MDPFEERGDEDLEGNGQLLRFAMLKKTSAAKELVTSGKWLSLVRSSLFSDCNGSQPNLCSVH